MRIRRSGVEDECVRRNTNLDVLELIDLQKRWILLDQGAIGAEMVPIWLGCGSVRTAMQRDKKLAPLQ